MASSNELYNKLAKTAKAFVESTSPKTAGSNEINHDATRALAASEFKMTWGPATYVASHPNLQGSKDVEAFLKHMESMTPSLKTWRIEVQDVTTDTAKREAVVRAHFHMQPKNENEAALNDIVFFIGMDESGEKVTRACEYLDAEASRIIQEKVNAAKVKQQGNY